MSDAFVSRAPQPAEQLPVPLFDGVVLAPGAHDGLIFLALRDLRDAQS